MAAPGRFERLLAPVDDAGLSRLAAEAAAVTRRHFGKAMRLFAPLYLSNECINSCVYCGFSRENAILRVTLEIEEVVREARHLAAQGFRSILLVAGEHPKFVSQDYLGRCIRALRDFIPSVALEIAPMETAEYLPLVAAGSEALIVYQETYDLSIYQSLHAAGPKKDYSWRLDCPERAYAAGFRRIGIGALFGPCALAARGIRARRSSGLFDARVLAGAIHREPAAHASGRRRIPAHGIPSRS